MMKLDLGCGISKREGYIGVDLASLPGVDVVHNLDEFPYPFSDNEVDEVWMDQVLEHLKEPLRAVEELHRICKHRAKVFIGVPYFRSFYAAIDPTHRNVFGVYWFSYFDPNHPFAGKYLYSNATFAVKYIEFDREWKGSKIGLLHRLLIKYAEHSPYRYEMKFSHLLPLNSLTFHLDVIKRDEVEGPG